MNKKLLRVLLIIGVFILSGIGIYFYFSNNSSKISRESNDYEGSRISTNTNNQNNITSSQDNSNKETNKTPEDKPQEEKRVGIAEESKQKNPEYKEEQLSTFSTKIYSKDSARQNNIKITCNTLNDTIVKNGSTFSFCGTVGQATSSKGYQEADIYDHDGNKKKGFGGGNCQVSSTLYNAVLSTSGLNVTERHEHSNKVPYVQKGKDAAVAYGSYDLKFQNNSGNDIKIKASTDDKSVTITLISLKQA